jgi:beta-lactam-binding protein with PASTA domain
VSFGGRALSALGKVGIALSVIIIFLFGFVGTVYLSLRTREVKVPDISGKDRFTAETILNDAGLNIRIRGTRPSTEKKPDTILSQMPEAGQVVKAGIPVAVEVSRTPKEGESAFSETEEQQQQAADKPADNANANQSSATNQNQNQNQNKPKNKNKNSNNKNSNNSNNSNNTNINSNNRNANANANRGANGNRNTNNSNNRNSNANTSPNANRGNSNANKRPVVVKPPAAGANKGTP